MSDSNSNPKYSSLNHMYRQVTAILFYIFALSLYTRVREIVSIIKIVNVIRCYCKDLTVTYLLSQHLHYREYVYLDS